MSVAALAAVTTVGNPANRLLRFGLLVLAAAPTLLAAWRLVGEQIPGIDLLIPLLATQRWIAGGDPYVAGSFAATQGPDLPFLYPPFVLPLLTPFLDLPIDAVLAGWVGICAGVAAWSVHRLAVPARWWVAFLIWPPFLEGIVSGNVAIVAFAAFAALFISDPGTTTDLHPIHRDPTDARKAALPEGAKATLVAAVKASQVHAWAYLFLHRPKAALGGLACLGVLVVATLPAVGVALWAGWIQQLQRAADPQWIYGGNGIGRIMPPALALVVAAASVLALRWVTPTRAGVWVGVLAVVGGLSVHTYGLLFLVPAMLHIRREIALVGAMFIGARNPAGILIGATIIVVATFASAPVSALREPDPP